MQKSKNERRLLDRLSYGVRKRLFNANGPNRDFHEIGQSFLQTDPRVLELKSFIANLRLYLIQSSIF